MCKYKHSLTKIETSYIVVLLNGINYRFVEYKYRRYMATILLFLLSYSMFHVTWTTFKFNRNQLGTVSAYVVRSMLWSNQRAH